MEDKSEIMIQDHMGEHKELRWETSTGVVHFIVNMEEEWLDIIYVSSNATGGMKKMITALVNQLPFNAVRFIAPMGDMDKELAEAFGEEMEKRGLVSKKESKPHQRNIEDALHNYTKVTDSYYDENEYEMIIVIWET